MSERNDTLNLTPWDISLTYEVYQRRQVGDCLYHGTTESQGHGCRSN